MDRIRKTAALATAATVVLCLAACGEKTAPEPQNEITGAAMPDTSQSGPNPPDAGATGVVPATGDVPVQSGQPQDPNANNSGLPPVTLPQVERK